MTRRKVHDPCILILFFSLCASIVRCPFPFYMLPASVNRIFICVLGHALLFIYFPMRSIACVYDSAMSERPRIRLCVFGVQGVNASHTNPGLG